MTRASSRYPIPDYMSAGVERARLSIVSSGARWSAVERTDIARVARAAKASLDRPETSLDATVADVAEMLAVRASSIDQETVDAFVEATGRGIESYVEIVGLVARLVALDTFATGIDSALVELSPSGDSEPSGLTRDDARKRSAFVPTVGPAGATSALSAVDSEDRAQEDLHGSLYLTYAEMGDLRIRKGLPRWQLELIAARTSVLNHCVF